LTQNLVHIHARYLRLPRKCSIAGARGVLQLGSVVCCRGLMQAACARVRQLVVCATTTPIMLLLRR